MHESELQLVRGKGQWEWCYFNFVLRFPRMVLLPKEMENWFLCIDYEGVTGVKPESTENHYKKTN